MRKDEVDGMNSQQKVGSMYAEVFTRRKTLYFILSIGVI